MDRSFITVLSMLGASLMLYMAGWTVGVTPASREEHAFMNELKTSEFGKDPSVRAAAAQAQESLYVSRAHFHAMQRAFEIAVAREQGRRQALGS